MATQTFTTATEQTNGEEAVLYEFSLPAEVLAGLITCPVSPEKARLLSRIYRKLTQNPSQEDAARECRFATFVLENMTWKDAESGDSGRTDYATWFHDARKRLIKDLQAEADTAAA